MIINRVIAFVVYVLLFLLFAFWLGSCSKVNIDSPSCLRYLELVDRYDGERIYQYTDTLWPNGRYNNVVCGDDIDKLLFHVPAFEGCIGGWQVVRYEILK